MIFKQLFHEESFTYTYLIGCKIEKTAVLIDSVSTEIDNYSALLDELGLSLKYALDTHVHSDHITASGPLKKRLGCEIAISSDCKVKRADVHINDGDIFQLSAAEQIRAISTPGHTKGSVCFLWRDRLFSGDSLLINGCGRTDYDGSDAGTLYDSITQALFTLPNDTLVYPGHDYNGRCVSNIIQERTSNERISGKTRTQFIEMMAQLDLPYPRLIDIAVSANQDCGEIL